MVRHLWIPIQVQGQRWGFLSAHTSPHSPFSIDDLCALQTIASVVAIVLVQQQQAAKLEVAKITQQGLEQQVAALQRIEAVLRESEERYALAANATNDGVWDWDHRTDEVYFSPRCRELLGYAEPELSNQIHDWTSLLHPEDVDSFWNAVTDYRAGRIEQFSIQSRLRHRDGTYRWIWSRGIAVRDRDGVAYRLAGTLSDITARKESEEHLHYTALHDPLTGLANRTLFMDRLEHAMALTRRYPEYRFAVVFLDLDRFKVINDSLGHLAGDQLLITVTQRLRDCLRSSDTCARLGGDEFALLLEYAQDDSEIITLVERIQQELKAPIELDGQEVLINASLGMILRTTRYEHAEDLLRDVDTAMYHAKASGRGRYAIFTQTMHEQAVSLLQLETDLRRAIDGQELRVFYQPVLDLQTQQVRGFEALVRWQHPRRGIVMPAEFIPLAEETGLISLIDPWVLRQACNQTQAWQQQYGKPLTISVNLSRKQFAQPDLVQQIEQILHDTELPAGCLKLEITESAIMENVVAATTMMQQLKAIGVQLALDDFGTGYSSLSHLHLFPIDILKIDPTFTHAVESNLEKIELIRSITKLAWNLGIDVVAEGVETQRQMSQLKLLNCDLAQGYLFSKPLCSEAVAEFLEGSK
ncbi:MAG: EAL domain-containing protein [Myxacorys californica WJT36-NPBG1]|jgi:diguanylate cyclase (GGDEF)-like protein/PAS domain S-box-containing protein|nr:EAL domain-containing protein [Myxacorys californica WJT36-NPBG1]